MTPDDRSPSISPETLRRIRRIGLRTRRLVRSALLGAYHSTFKGRGMTFDAVRPYEPGDDVRHIDWNVTARAGGEPFVKRYAEERELTVLIALDSSASCFFGTTGQQKRELAAELGAVLALTAIRNNDKVGLLIFSDRVEQFTSPRKGRNHVLRLIRDVLAAPTAGRGTDLALALRAASRLLHQRAIIFLISDFFAATDDYASALRIAARRHDVIAVVLTDPRESAWPDAGLVTLRDAETSAVRTIDTGEGRWRRAFAARAARVAEARESALASAGADRIDLATDGDVVAALMQFFQRRAVRR
jgi:uncharacterized protein (DUF58 family)